VSFFFKSVERFIAGTVGVPGERAFFIQARNGNRLTTVAVEKIQVAALAQRLEIIIRDLRRSNVALRVEKFTLDDEPLETPIEAEFDIGAISMAWDETELTMTIELFEIVAEGEEPLNALKVGLTLSQCSAFVSRSKALVEAGRPPCPFCGASIDPQGHLCPRANGYRR